MPLHQPQATRLRSISNIRSFDADAPGRSNNGSDNYHPRHRGQSLTPSMLRGFPDGRLGSAGGNLYPPSSRFPPHPTIPLQHCNIRHIILMLYTPQSRVLSGSCRHIDFEPSRGEPPWWLGRVNFLGDGTGSSTVV